MEKSLVCQLFSMFGIYTDPDRHTLVDDPDPELDPAK
jgi:hypothetical protein